MRRGSLPTALLLLGVRAMDYKFENINVSMSKEEWMRDLGVRDVFSGDTKHYRIAWIGDSTTRNTIHFLCDILGGKNATHPHSPDCLSPDGRVEIIGKSFGGPADPWDMRTAGALLDALTNRSLAGREGAPFDAVYFGTTLLHAMQLLPLLEFRGRKDFNLSGDVAAAVKQMRARGACPVLHTVNWICDRRFFGEKGAIAQGVRASARAAHNHFGPLCEARNRSRSDTRMCTALSFTARGSEYAAQLERAAVKALANPIDIVDAHAITREQCWAAKDGRHYTPLLPMKIALLVEALRSCLG